MSPSWFRFCESQRPCSYFDCVVRTRRDGSTTGQTQRSQVVLQLQYPAPTAPDLVLLHQLRVLALQIHLATVQTVDHGLQLCILLLATQGNG